jgi:pyrroline-5-carboxylate reductase
MTDSGTPLSPREPQPIAFIGGGNMASAIIGGLLRRGLPPTLLRVVEPFAPAREKLRADLDVMAQERAGPALGDARLVIWAVKPQTFKEAAEQAGPYTRAALHLSVAAGIRSETIAGWLQTQRVVRAMPNTPALIGQGITALFGRADVTVSDRAWVEQVIATTGEHLWVSQEAQLDAVTALSGSGPAYVFYFLEAMRDAGAAMGLPPAQALHLATSTFAGAAALTAGSDEPPEVLRQRVTSKGGTTQAALSSMEADRIGPLFMRALQAAQRRAAEMGDEFGA